MKKLFFVVIFSVVFTNSLFAVRKYTKVTIAGESAKMFNDENCYTDYREMYYDGSFFNDNFYYKYDCFVENMTTDEINYYSKKDFTTSKVEFKNRTEFFIFTRNDGAKKITFYKSETYKHIKSKFIRKTIAEAVVALGSRPDAY